MSTWEISDVHGHYDEFISLKNKIEVKDRNAVIVLTGDICDRGPKTAEMIRWCMEHANKPDGKYILLMGNHEELILEWYCMEYMFWVEQDPKTRGEIPRSDYDFADVVYRQGWFSKEQIEPVMRFFANLPLYKVVQANGKQYIIAHAWAPKEERMKQIMDGDREPTSAEWNVFLWDRRLGETYDSNSYMLVHGHTPTIDVVLKKKARIQYFGNTINVDCGVYARALGGRLAALCLEDGTEIYE